MEQSYRLTPKGFQSLIDVGRVETDKWLDFANGLNTELTNAEKTVEDYDRIISALLEIIQNAETLEEVQVFARNVVRGEDV